MSGLAGIFNLDGRPADAALLHRMTSTISHRGPDGIHHMVEGTIAIGHCMLCTTPESLHETQPLWDEARMFCLAMDGRVDNREELASDLKATGAILRDDTDAELVLKAYVTWGEDSPRRIVGDFAYVIWCARERSLFCARDHLGVRPFFYFHSSSVFIWASELQQLLKHPAVPRQPNEGMVAEYLANSITSLEETLYCSILRLPHAHSMKVSGSSLTKVRYWAIDTEKQIRYKSDSEYTDHFLSTFETTVRSHLRSHLPIGAELSGGLDSSSVVGACGRLLRAGEVRAPGIETFSMVFPGLPCDETSYIDAVAAREGLTSHRVTPALDSRWYSYSASRYQDFPDFPNGYNAENLRTLARARGIRTILTGLGGDDWFAGGPNSSLWTRMRGSLSRVGPLRHIWRTFRPSQLAPWVDPRLKSRVDLESRLRASLNTGGPGSGPCGGRYRSLDDGFGSIALLMNDRASARCGLELRHPFHDRRMIELAFALPGTSLWDAGINKRIIRSAGTGLLPEVVRSRKDKAEFSYCFADTFLALRPLFEDRMIVVESGWIIPSQLKQMFQEMAGLRSSGKGDFLPHSWPLWMAIGIELWMKGLIYGESYERRPRHPEAAVC